MRIESIRLSWRIGISVGAVALSCGWIDEDLNFRSRRAGSGHSS